MRDYADKRNVTLVPTIAQLVPLMILWLMVMLAPIVALPAWGAGLVWLVVFGLSFFVFPHVDGTRRLAFA